MRAAAAAAAGAGAWGPAARLTSAAGHINPIVTLALMIQKRVSPKRCLVYWTAQYSGAVFGALLLWAGISNTSYAQVNPSTDAIVNFTQGVTVVPAVRRAGGAPGGRALTRPAPRSAAPPTTSAPTRCRRR